MSSLHLQHVPASGAVTQAEDHFDPLASIRRKQQALQQAKTEDFDLPGYGGELVVRYRRLGLDGYRKALIGSGDTELDANLQFLIDACDGIYRRRDDGSLYSLWPDDVEHRPTEAPRYGDMDDLLGLEHDTVRRSVLALFGDNELVLTEHSGQVEAWMRSLKATEDRQAAGG
jgi:hypothetical protein